MTVTMSSVYNDDEAPPPAHARRSGVLVLDTCWEYMAVPNDEDHDRVAVMVHVKAPALVAAVPLDLVVVLDVSESMAGTKLAQVKRAMGFVIDRLGPGDRLSVVAFSDDARPVIRLTRMTDEGKAVAKSAVESLVASGSADVHTGLDEAAKVLVGSRHRNDVAGVILVAGGRQGNTGDCNDVPVPRFLRHTFGSGHRPKPVHTFLLGSDDSESCHDAAAAAAVAMHNISEVTGGTFSFVEDHAAIQEALARCVGGLLSVTATDAQVEIGCACAEDKLNFTAIKSGRYENNIFPFDRAYVNVGDLYADEERRILCFLDVPRLDDADDSAATWLLQVGCTYIDAASRQEVELPEGEEFVNNERPMEATDVARCVELEKELLRVSAMEDMALAREAAERGDYDEAARILDARRESLSGDVTCTALAAELHELRQRVSDQCEYRKTGRACILASMSSHALQRGSSSAHFGRVGSSVFATPTMRKMEKLSQKLRRKQETRPSTLPENRRKTVLPRSRLEARLASAVPRLSSMLSRYRRLLLKR